MMAQIWDFLSTEGFQPHGMCLLWRPDVFWAHVVSDAVIALSYFSIPAALFYLAVRRSDLIYRWVLYLFAAFIVACGLTHLFGIWTLWVPDYGIQALLKLATALISVVTAIAIWPLMPKLLALPSARQLAEKNAALAHEIAERQAAEVELQALNEDLEQRVAERTATLEEVNRELIRSRAEAEQASRAKSDFLAMMSHELRTPLNAILGFSEIIKSQPAGDGDVAKTRDYATHIHDSGQHLLDLITDILDLSKIESGTEKLNEEAASVAEIVTAAMTVTSTAAEGAQVKLALDMPANAPRLYADPRKLKQILINLLSNAVKFTPAEGQVILKVRPEAPEGFLFQVADNGIGIAPEDIPRALAPFQQVDDCRQRTHEGTGLGLPLTKALAEMHGGSLLVDSTPGAGTTVTVCFPRERALCDGADAPQAGVMSNCGAPNSRICPWRQPSINTCAPQNLASGLPCGPARKR
ncbi:sensor histidine kinase [Pelagibius marinus]|uniref:sensor histidine kinase n=1 Tax=Pelagibius marinus TaxID=2762760 RepID=UPI001872A8B0|nr:ATP-binding protein [Pelagibius marinus]